MLRYVAPSGTPIALTDIARWLGAMGGAAGVSSALATRIEHRFGTRHVFLASTGRAAMTVLLSAMRTLAPAHRDEVVMPSYTCYSVAASAVKAGLKVRLVDTDPDTLDYAPAQLAGTDFSRVLAMVATNLYGLPGNLPHLARTAQSHGVFLIDDAAQAMAASVDGRLSGTWGDAGLFSFDKGKNISAIDGGAVITHRDDLAQALSVATATLAPAPLAASVRNAGKALAYSVLLRPRLYGIPARVPYLGLGKTVFTTEFPLAKPDPVLMALASVMLERLDEFTRARVSNAQTLRQMVRDVPGVRTIAIVEGARPAYLRLPVLLDGIDRSRLLADFAAAGIGATASYPASLADVPELQAHLAAPAPSMPGGRRVAESILTLPTHPFVTARDLASMVRILQSGSLKCAA